MSVPLTIAEAKQLVRKNLDELEANGSGMYGEDTDNAVLDSLIERSLPEAINAVNLAAPVTLLDGIELEPDNAEDFSFVSPVVDGVLEFKILREDFLRLVAFRATDSDVVVTSVLDEASAEGRKQLNKYLRGRSDRPRLVKLQGMWKDIHDKFCPDFKYYTLSINPEEGEESGAVALCSYVKEEKYDESSAASDYHISQRLRQNIIDYTTALVLTAMGDQRSQSYYQKASIFK